MKIKLRIMIVLSVFILLVACSNNQVIESDTNDIKQLVHEYSVETKENEIASITAKELIITNDDDGNKTVYQLPEGEFFVSIAPYINETHPCKDHNLTSCQGEMVNKEFDVLIEDTDGNVVIDDTLQTETNGFIDLWLPRDKSFNITISHDGKKVESDFSTFKQDGTCITTLQLM